ncbi:hypothetical protein B9Q04_14345 [Candidatus Marsarchaeota G2 archaeon BE_D]|jgi:hypothetical protein|uniref:PhoU domain-containing protein n=1 Tax=Candidatus Marsarchaeota G2 archaeon BE_D TaxID=1978158 RepID=A0A2R6C785_9ARCH|nr:MAG: hypothetical protein B9Q04_14345 [Candidatus Marsarchaeota G2 archaeon BE_D]
MADDQLLHRKINAALQNFMEEAHTVFRHLAEACDLFIKGDKNSINMLASKSNQTVFEKLSEHKHNISIEVGKSYSILPLSTEHLRICLLIWDASYVAERVIQRLSHITGRTWVEKSFFYDSIGLIASSILHEFEIALENLTVLLRNKEKAMKHRREIDEQFLQITHYIDALDKLILDEVDKSPALISFYDVANDLEEISRNILEASELVLVIAYADSALD